MDERFGARGIFPEFIIVWLFFNIIDHDDLIHLFVDFVLIMYITH